MIVSWRKGAIVQTRDIPEEVSHLFNNPNHYHWNYPHPGGHQIMKDTQIVCEGSTIILSFDF